MSQFTLRNERTGDLIVSHLMVANTFIRRFRGLQVKRCLDGGSGLLLVPCGSIHTFWMRFPIDVLFLSSGGQVEEIKQEVRPWRCVISGKKPHAVLEVASGASSNHIQVGDELRLVTEQTVTLAKSMDFLRSCER